MDDSRTRRTPPAKVWRLLIVTLFFVATIAPAFLLTVHIGNLWFLALLAIPLLWIVSPRMFASWLPSALRPPISGRRLPFALLFTVVVLLTINLSGVDYVENLYALGVVIGLTALMIIFIALMTRMPRSQADRFLDWLD
ncbi:MAG: hypothetical protein EP347_08710 [Alphaproteobacteria bacterium]|nr:MAG: hypothetical protein EP347_08710 [Alphaproteobacteria bacterium]